MDDAGGPHASDHAALMTVPIRYPRVPTHNKPVPAQHVICIEGSHTAGGGSRFAGQPCQGGIPRVWRADRAGRGNTKLSGRIRSCRFDATVRARYICVCCRWCLQLPSESCLGQLGQLQVMESRWERGTHTRLLLRGRLRTAPQFIQRCKVAGNHLPARTACRKACTTVSASTGESHASDNLACIIVPVKYPPVPPHGIWVPTSGNSHTRHHRNGVKCRRVFTAATGRAG